MFRCIICLNAFDDSHASDEHVFPEAIGGLLKLRDMCVPCNSHLGEKIDAPLVNHRYMQWSRRNLKLATRAGKVPNPLERVLVPETGQRARWELDGTLYFHPTQREGEHGEVVLVVDKTDEHRLPEMLAKASSRRGVVARGEVMSATNRVSLSFELGFDDERYRLGILKIAYELGCKVLGPQYVDDPIAARYRTVLCAPMPSRQVLETARIPGEIGGLYGPAMLPLPQFLDSWLGGVVFVHESRVCAYVRLFNRFDGRFTLSETAAAYSCSPSGRGWLNDVAAGTMRETNIEEMRALAIAA